MFFSIFRPLISYCNFVAKTHHPLCASEYRHLCSTLYGHFYQLLHNNQRPPLLHCHLVIPPPNPRAIETDLLPMATLSGFPPVHPAPHHTQRHTHTSPPALYGHSGTEDPLNQFEDHVTITFLPTDL